ncbi:glycosyltransferase [Halomarina ordinaria]|uniref:Glycosyltransferase n=1 Tax=Halomarina ordinaria TaxID=3033939 RepID=A0ABD5UHW3_9EURY|nr:glycosyltransferase [Halomarina sp. PSRA2]
MLALVALGVALLAATALPYVGFLALYAWVRPSGSPAAKRPSEPTVSVVLPTYNEARIVENKLRDLVALDYPMEKVEIVVVDSSTDETPDLVESFFADRDAPASTLIREGDRRGLARALNDGYAAAENEIIVKTDCDARLAPDALREAMANFADPAVDGVTGRNAEVLGGSEVETDYRGIQSHIQTLESHLDSTFIFHGPFSAFRREAVVPIDPGSLADDSELALRIRRNGGRVVFDPAVAYMEAAHSAFAKRRKQKDRRAMGLVRLLVQQRDALGRHGRYGRVVLPFNWLFMLVSPWLLATGLAALVLGAVTTAGVAGLALPAALLAFVAAGSRDVLGPFQPFYALFDAQVSLLSAAVRLPLTSTDGLWEPDAELREAYD